MKKFKLINIISIVVIYMSSNAFCFNILEYANNKLTQNLFPQHPRVLLIQEQQELDNQDPYNNQLIENNERSWTSELVDGIKNIFMSVNGRPSILFRYFFPDHPSTLLWQEIDEMNDLSG